MTLPLDMITTVYDIVDCDDNAPLFCIDLVADFGNISNGGNPNQWKPTDKLCICQPLDGRYRMDSFLKALAKQIAINKEIKAEDVLKSIEPSEIQVKHRSLFCIIFFWFIIITVMGSCLKI